MLLFTEEMPTKNDVIKSDIIVLNVSKEEVGSGDISRLEKAIDLFMSCKVNGRGKLAIFFEGYDNVPYEIYEITEIRNWVKLAFDKYPYIIYFLSPSPMVNSRNIITSCICDLEIVKSMPSMTFEQIVLANLQGIELPKVNIQPKMNPEMGEKIIKGTICYGKMIGEKEEIIAEVLKYVFIFIANYIGRH
jgi:hypothetical protein